MQTVSILGHSVCCRGHCVGRSPEHSVNTTGQTVGLLTQWVTCPEHCVNLSEQIVWPPRGPAQIVAVVASFGHAVC